MLDSLQTCAGCAVVLLQILTMQADPVDCAGAASAPSSSRLQVVWTLASVTTTPLADTTYTIDTAGLLPLSVHVTPDPHILVVPGLHVRPLAADAQPVW